MVAYTTSDILDTAALARELHAVFPALPAPTVALFAVMVVRCYTLGTGHQATFLVIAAQTWPRLRARSRR